jgi:NADPH:quinone reductase-like Zn-dependent oxidoreductase
VIATTSIPEKAERLKALGASDVINYWKTPDWDEQVRALTEGRGVDCVVEIGGPGTIAMSLKALAIGGHISLIGSSCRHPESGSTRYCCQVAALLSVQSASAAAPISKR